jgi:hypothetical protein
MGPALEKAYWESPVGSAHGQCIMASNEWGEDSCMVPLQRNFPGEWPTELELAPTRWSKDVDDIDGDGDLDVIENGPSLEEIDDVTDQYTAVFRDLEAGLEAESLEQCGDAVKRIPLLLEKFPRLQLGSEFMEGMEEGRYKLHFRRELAGRFRDLCRREKMLWKSSTGTFIDVEQAKAEANARLMGTTEHVGFFEGVRRSITGSIFGSQHHDAPQTNS